MSEKEPPETVPFHYIKSTGFHVVPCDGVLGGITPQSKVFLSIYTERAALPRLLVHEMHEDGTLGDIVQSEGRSGIVRDMQIGITMDFKTATNLHKWLGNIIQQMEKEEAEQKTGSIK